MANQTVEFIADTGLTITAKLFAISSTGEVSDTVSQSVTATEHTNALGSYQAVFVDCDRGTYKCMGYDPAGEPVFGYFVSLSTPLG